MLKGDHEYLKFSRKTFYALKGNHKVIVWQQHVDRMHSEHKDWHYTMDCIILNMLARWPFFSMSCMMSIGDFHLIMFIFIVLYVYLFPTSK